MSTLALHRATFRITDSDLEFMVLEKDTMPGHFQDYQVVREGVLDNHMMAEHGFDGSSPERFQEAGRISGFMREFGATANMLVFEGLDFVGATQQLISVQKLETSGFYDESAALKILQGGAAGVTSSTVIDFRVGRLLGVAFIGSIGDQDRLEMASELAYSLEKQIVQVVLGAH